MFLVKVARMEEILHWSWFKGHKTQHFSEMKLFLFLIILIFFYKFFVFGYYKW
jgi:hypothetical protein